MLNEPTHQKLITMKLFGMAQGFQERLGRIDHQDLSPSALMGLIVDDEYLYRENRRLAILLKGARFKDPSACLEAIDYTAARGISKARILDLAQNRWVGARQSVLITGPSGAGKSFLAQALGHNACRAGWSAHYLRLPALLQQFVQARAQGTYAAILKRLGRFSVLVIDDLGLSGITQQEGQDLLETLEERYGKGPSIVTHSCPSPTGTSIWAQDASPMPSWTG